MEGTTTMAQKKYETHEDYLDAKRKRALEYNATTVTRININLNHKTDTDILYHLANISNTQGYIKDLIRQDIAREKTDGAKGI